MLRADQLPIGALSAATGVNIETIRYYEKIGLMPAPPRTEGRQRVYDASHLKRLTFIRRGRSRSTKFASCSASCVDTTSPAPTSRR